MLLWFLKNKYEWGAIILRYSPANSYFRKGHMDGDNQNLIINLSHWVFKEVRHIVMHYAFYIIFASCANVYHYCLESHRGTSYTLACQCAYSLSKTPSRFFGINEVLYYSYMGTYHFST